MRYLLVLMFFAGAMNAAFSQEAVQDTVVVDPKYREDQFYFGVSYNLLGQKPQGLSQRGFSNGVHFAVLRDMPINQRRNVAVAVGLGLSLNSYNQNMLINTTDEKEFTYEIINERILKPKRNKFQSLLVELPLEFRWRTSTATDYKFWRIYSGVKIGYVFYSFSKFTGNVPDIKIVGLDGLNSVQYGLTFSAGYSTWNFNLYYGLNPIFQKEAKLEGKSIDMNSVKIGLMFYIL